MVLECMPFDGALGRKLRQVVILLDTARNDGDETRCEYCGDRHE